MNLSKLVDEVNKDLDESFESGELIGWFNRCLDDLTPIARIESKYSTDLTAPVILPDDLYEIAFVLLDGSELYNVPVRDKTKSGYKVWGNELTLQNTPESSLLEVFYYKRLSHLEESEDVPEIEPSFHNLLVLYASYLSQYAEEEPERQIDAFNRYHKRKQEYETFVFRNREADEIKDVTRW